jgi:calpain
MYRDSMSPGDIKMGILGDCWFMGSLLIQSTNPELLNNLIVYDGIQYGFAVFQFFKDGKWQYQIVDTRIPYNTQSKTPLYGHCADITEFWVPLMEKAYAKLHKTYENLNGG